MAAEDAAGGRRPVPQADQEALCPLHHARGGQGAGISAPAHPHRHRGLRGLARPWHPGRTGPFDAAFSARLLESAVRAWAWLEQNPRFVPYENPRTSRPAPTGTPTAWTRPSGPPASCTPPRARPLPGRPDGPLPPRGTIQVRLARGGRPGRPVLPVRAGRPAGQGLCRQPGRPASCWPRTPPWRRPASPATARPFRPTATFGAAACPSSATACCSSPRGSAAARPPIWTRH